MYCNCFIDALAGTSARVLCHLPERENLQKSIRRERRKHVPANPLSIEDFGDIPEDLKLTSTGDRFLM